MEICVLEKEEKNWFQRAEIEEEKIEIEPLACDVLITKVPVRKGRIARKARRELLRRVENQNAVYTLAEELKGYEKEVKGKSMCSMVPALALKKLCSYYGVDLAQTDVAVCTAKMNLFAQSVLEQIAGMLRFATIYTQEEDKAREWTVAAVEKTGLSFRVAPLKETYAEPLLIKIEENVSFLLNDKKIELSNLVYDLPQFTQKYSFLPIRQIFEFAAKNLDTNQLFIKEKVKIRALK